MKGKLIGLVSGLLLLGCALFGIIEKQTYTHYVKEAEPLAHFEVVIFSEDDYPCSELLTDDDEYIESIFDESEFVFKGKAIGDLQLEFNETSQLFQVEKVFRGEKLEEGEIIRILYAPIVFPEGQSPILSLNYTNIAKDGDEYLIFTDAFEGEMNSDQDGRRVFRTTTKTINPIYAYHPGDSRPMSEMGYDKGVVFYGDVKDNEYFAATPKALEALNRHREKMIQKFQ